MIICQKAYIIFSVRFYTKKACMLSEHLRSGACKANLATLKFYKYEEKNFKNCYPLWKQTDEDWCRKKGPSEESTGKP